MADRAAFNLATLGPAPLARKLYAAAAAGFPAVGLLRDEIEQAGSDVSEELRLNDLAPAELTALHDWMSPERTTRMIALAQAEAAFEFASRLGCSVVIACPPPGPLDPVAAARGLADLCRLAEPFSVPVGFELPSSAQHDTSIALARRIMESADAPNLGLVIDAFHFHRSGSTLEMLEAVPGDRIAHVQLSDVPDLPARELHDRHRVYPGAGAVPLEPLVALLRGKRYSGYYSIELHNEDYWQEDPLVVAREALRSLRRLDIT